MVDIASIIPLNESFDIQTSITFNTTVLTDDSTAEQRVVNWQSPLRTFDIRKKLAKKSEIDDFIAFNNLTSGSELSFLYKDPSDYSATDAEEVYSSGIYTQGILLPVANGVRSEFQVIKHYTCGDNSHFRPITQPSGLVIKSGGVTVTNWTLGVNGKVTFDAPPTLGLTASFIFSVPVRFQEDEVNFRLTSHNEARSLYEIPGLILKEIREIPFYYPVDEIYSDLSIAFDIDFYFASTETPRANTEIIELSSGFEKRNQRADQLWMSQLGTKNKLPQSKLAKLLCFWLCAKGQGSRFDYLDNQYSGSTYPARFNGNTLTYLRQSTQDLYQVSGLQLRQFKSGVVLQEGNGYGITGSVLPIARICQIARPDGVSLGFTTCDRDIVLSGGERYKANTAFDPTAKEANADLSVDNQEIKSILNSDDITDADLRAGVYSDAVITIGIVRYNSLPPSISDSIIEQVGVVGEITTTDTYYVMENLSKPAALLRQNASVKTSPICRYRFGDNKCTKNLTALTFNVEITAIKSERQFEIDGSIANGLLDFGEITFSSGDNDGITMGVLGYNTNIIELFLAPPKPAQVGDTLIAIAGCNKTWTVCNSTYSNGINFGGEPSFGNFMPGNDFLLHGPKSS